MTEDQLAAIEARERIASPGPWNARTPHGPGGRSGGMPPEFSLYIAQSWEWEGRTNEGRDVDFVCHARQDVPALLVEVRRLQQENRQLLHQLSLGRLPLETV